MIFLFSDRPAAWGGPEVAGHHHQAAGIVDAADHQVGRATGTEEPAYSKARGEVGSSERL